MADRVIVVPDSVGDILQGRVIPERMLADLINLAGISPETLGKISDSLLNTEGFLSDSELEKKIKTHLSDKDEFKAVLNTLENISSDRIEWILQTLSKWRAAKEENQSRLPLETIEALRSALPTLIKNYPALERMRKAETLELALGQGLESVQFICDARPVFDKERKLIEGFATITTLKLELEEDSESRQKIEVRISPEMLDELIEKSQQAKVKIKTLREQISVWMPEGISWSDGE